MPIHFTVMLTVCFLGVPFVCLRLGMERRSWRIPLALMLAAAAATPLLSTSLSYLDWRWSVREHLRDPPALYVPGRVGEAPTKVPGRTDDNVVVYAMPDGEVLRIPTTPWSPFRPEGIRPDHWALLASASLGLGTGGYLLGRAIAGRRSRHPS